VIVTPPIRSARSVPATDGQQAPQVLDGLKRAILPVLCRDPELAFGHLPALRVTVRWFIFAFAMIARRRGPFHHRMASESIGATIPAHEY
jgi:hypothetical protein